MDAADVVVADRQILAVVTLLEETGHLIVTEQGHVIIPSHH